MLILTVQFLKTALSGIRVVKSFANENVEMKKFQKGNENFVSAKKTSYKYMGIYNCGLRGDRTLITVIVLLFCGRHDAKGAVLVTDLITFLLYIK